VRLAYADPPYPGQAKRHYADHPDYAGEVDRAELVERLALYDGWALSTSVPGLQEVLALCPADVRIASWHITNSEPPGNRGTWHWSWEPVIVRAARPPAITIRDVLRHHAPHGFFGNEITGQKPVAFCEWVFRLIGAEPGDELDDLFPGSGAVAKAWQGYDRQLAIV
jgi:hypothetical protein